MNNQKPEMTKIHILERAVAERIAAGEVVERPASVVKELLENAIDAGASAISVEIREGGLSAIRTSDNGSGMARQDAQLSVERFATSKIATERDLDAVRTLGFRGEALPSIASMSQFEIVTRTRDEIEGTRVRVTDGQAHLETAGAPVGTLVTVRQLFYNAPARRKFLKAPLRETELVQKTLISYALAYPSIAFRLLVDGHESLVLPSATPLERIAAIWGREVAGEMLQVNYTSVDLSVRGFVSRPTLVRSGRDWQSFYVNGRPIRSGLLAVTLERPFAGLIPPNRHPLAVIQMDIDPQLVDVNVHPRKSEVRFYQERAIYGAVGQAVEQALRVFAQTTQSKTEAWPFAGATAQEPQSVPALHDERADYGITHWRAVAQVHNTYILAQSGDGMVIVDQHAAQEQIYYELLTTAAGGRARLPNEQTTAKGDEEGGERGPKQPSSVAGHLQVTAREGQLLENHLDEYRALGIDLEPFGENTFRVNALPAFVPVDPLELMAVLLQEHGRNLALGGDALRDKLAARTACVSAVKAGDALSPAQQQALLDDLAQAYSPATCPHGRPVFVMLRLEELERRFLRR
jgi:DNA mismatch repair protein MutL